MNPFFRIEEHGNGKKICAERAILPGTELCSFTGKIIDYEDTLALGHRESFAMQVDKRLYIYLEPPARYFNHCCEPNCGVTPGRKLIAIRKIDRNEELRWDYSTSMLEHHWTMKCECRKPTCRKVVSDFDKLPKRTQEEYVRLGIVQTFILEALGYKK
jgi:hypothetical protein